MKILCPVLPTERFYDAVVASADLLAEKGGTITFLFTTTRPPPMWLEDQPSQRESEAEIAPEDEVDDDVIEEWRTAMREGLADARDLLYERGIGDEQVNYVFADFETTPAQAIADEAAAGSYDLVVLSRGDFIQLPDTPGDAPADIASEVQQLADDGVKLLVT